MFFHLHKFLFTDQQTIEYRRKKTHSTNFRLFSLNLYCEIFFAFYCYFVCDLIVLLYCAAAQLFEQIKKF